MKRLIPSLLLLAVFAYFACQLTSCKRTPSPPTEQDAVAVWKDIARTPHLRDLIALKKTNGQMAEANGVPVYTFYYEATVKDVVQLGNRAPGTIETYKGDFPFQWTENGWTGPDHHAYPAH
jgi:hypothetical protein